MSCLSHLTKALYRNFAAGGEFGDWVSLDPLWEKTFAPGKVISMFLRSFYLELCEVWVWISSDTPMNWVKFSGPRLISVWTWTNILHQGLWVSILHYMSERDPLVSLRQAVDFIREAQALVEGLSLEELVADSVRLRAFERVMELIGESVKRVPDDFRMQYPSIPWRKITGMRDVISHAYEDLMYEILWDALEIHVPVVLLEFERILASE
jgi:uncharacterized protein with HEPN domain